jgi:hypothetical protein
MFNTRHAVLSAFVLSFAAPALAQSEAELRDFFEGKSVRVKIDMPASQEGIDVYPDARRPMDFDRYSSRLKSYGIALRNGDSVMITRVRLKEKLIEFHLGGGGYGTFGDDTGTVTATTVPKSNREKDLEKAVKAETNADRKRRLQRELDDLRRDREREDAMNRNIAASASEANKSRIAEKRLQGGSRFNIRYQNGVPPGLGADGIMRALDEYLDFPFASDRPPSGLQQRPAPAAAPAPAPPRPSAPSASGDIRKGMTMVEVNLLLGKPDKTTPRTEGGMRMVTATYTKDDHIVTVEFVEGVVVKYSIASK